MPIQYVGGVSSGRNGNSNATTTQSLTGLTGGIASAPAEGDFVIVACAVGSQARNPAQAISGYTTLGTQLNATAVTYDTSLQVSYKWMTSTPDTQITIPAQGNVADGQSWAVMVFRGVDPSTQFDVASQSAIGTGTGRPDPAAIQPTSSGAWIVCAAAAAAAATTTAFTFPADFSDDALQATGADTNDSRCSLAYHDGWTSGSYNPAQYTGGTTGANDSWAAWTMALRPNPINSYSHTASGGMTAAGAATSEFETTGLAIVGASVVAGTTAQTTYTGFTVPSGCNKLLVFVGAADGTHTTCSWNSTSMSALGSAVNSVWSAVKGFYLDSPSVGNYNLVVGAAVHNQVTVAFVPLQNAETGAPAYAELASTGDDNTPEITVAGSVSGDLVVGCVFTDASPTLGGENGTRIGSIVQVGGGDSQSGAQYRTATGANTVLSWTQNGGAGNEGHAIVAYAVGGSGATDFPHTASGGAVTGGAATLAYTHAFAHTASGGLVSGGDATESYSAGAQDFPYTASGGASFAGAATVARTVAHAHSASGGAVSAGAATLVRTVAFSYSASSGGALAGTATFSFHEEQDYWSNTYWSSNFWAANYWSSALSTNSFGHTSTGGMTAAGAATLARTMAWNRVASGGLVSAGAATVSWKHTFAYSASGGMVLGGAATQTGTHAFAHSASGGLVSGGAGTQTGTHAWARTASGGATLGGDASEIYQTAGTNDFFHTATGGAGTGGAATVTRTVARTHVSTGGAVSAGACSSKRGFAHSASGGAVSSGSAAVAKTKAWAYTALGGMLSGGACSTLRGLNFAASGGASAEGYGDGYYTPATPAEPEGSFHRFVHSFTQAFAS